MSNFRVEKTVPGYYVKEGSGSPGIGHGTFVVQSAQPAHIVVNPSPSSPQSPTQSGYQVSRPSVVTHAFTRQDSDPDETQLKQRVSYQHVNQGANYTRKAPVGSVGYSGEPDIRLQPSSPGPPPYSISVQHVRSPSSPQHQRITSPYHPSQDHNVATYHEPAFAKTSPAYRSQVTVEPKYPRSQSPFQDRRDIEMAVPNYTSSYTREKYPEGAPSRIVYTTKSAPQGQGYVQSRPLHQTDPPPPQSPTPSASSPPASSTPSSSSSSKPRSPTASSPFSYQLKPTMNAAQTAAPDTTHTEEDGTAGAYPKEAEVDALTDLLMKNMQAAADPDFFGMCAKCGQSIMGESTGCTALDQLFHIECFTCISCDACLRGQPFYAMEGKPYCEACYLNTLEKCSVCSKVITDRVLRATGKPYHPNCFMCVVCGKNLDGVPFTVDATSQIHCIEDFHKKFAPRCCVCGLPIVPTSNSFENVRIVALDRSFHVQCYKCEDCGVLLSSKEEGRGCYPLDDHILCCSCNAKRINALTTKMTTEL